MTSRPLMNTWPLLGVSKPDNRRKRVVFPQPDGPSKVKNSPSIMSNCMFFKASWSSNCFDTPVRVMIGLLISHPPVVNECRLGIILWIGRDV